jgi:DNA-binding transcriptional MerR regulator
LTRSIQCHTLQIKFSDFDFEANDRSQDGAQGRMELFAEGEIEQVERDRAGGITSGEVVRLFEAKGARLSASTFRKYVQLGLLPRSRRVGRKGKHTGSTGLYPVAVVRRIALVKRMMAEGYTVDEIRGSFLTVRNRIEDVDRGLSELVAAIAVKARAHPRRRRFQVELGRAEREARAALRKLERVGGAVATIAPADAGGPGGPGAGAAPAGR